MGSFVCVCVRELFYFYHFMCVCVGSVHEDQRTLMGLSFLHFYVGLRGSHSGYQAWFASTFTC